MDDQQVERTGEEVRARLQQELGSISVEPFAHYRARAQRPMRPQQRIVRLAGVFATVVAVLVLAVVAGSVLTNLRRNIAASPTPTVAPNTSASPSASPSASAASPSPLPSGRPAAGIEAYGLGTLRGEYAFVLNGGASTMPGAIAEVWAVPLAGGQARPVARFANSTTPSTNTGDNMLARQFSPDGRRLVLAAATPRRAGGERVGLFIMDLESGQVTQIGADDAVEYEKPAWSPDGRRIAYVKRSILGDGTTGNGSDQGIWVMNADGTGDRKIPMPPGPQSEFPAQTFLYSWTPDGRIAWFYQSTQNTLIFTDVDTGVATTIRNGVGDARGLSFRTTAPRLAGSFSDRPGNCPGHLVAVLDGAPEQVLVRGADRPQCPQRLHDVRWSPTHDEVLYILESQPSELHIHALTGSDQRIATQADAVLAEWSTDGTRLVYVNHNLQAPTGIRFVGGELRSVRRDGSDDHTIFTPPATPTLSDIAVRTYP